MDLHAVGEFKPKSFDLHADQDNQRRNFFASRQTTLYAMLSASALAVRSRTLARNAHLEGRGLFASEKGSMASFSTASLATSAPPTDADVVVVGGGSLGMSILYHLQKKGLSAVLLERNQLTSGTTWHSAGMLWRLRPSDIDIELHGYTREMCMRLEEETGIASWTENGGLFVASNDERFEEYKRLAETGKYFGIESSILKPSEINDIHPLLRTDDTVGAMYSPSDGTIDPTGIVNAYTKAAKKLGARVFERTGVGR